MSNLSNFFQSQNEIPSEHRLDTPFHQNQYLVNGEIRTWQGETTEVLSPIFIKNEESNSFRPNF
jgi:glyceraldehyde-3-phosphate dehydrogenase (NADP+)